MTINSEIIATGSFLPEKVVTNKDLEKIVETSDQWIFERTGIRSRHVVSDAETTTTMAIAAAKDICERAGIEGSSIDLIIVATCTADEMFPSVACKVQAALGAAPCMAFDVAAACAGFIYGLSIADKYIKSGAIKRALVLGAETMTRTLDWNDRSTCILFGDGAAGVLLEASSNPGILSTHAYADGNYGKLIAMHNVQMAEKNAELTTNVKMEGNKVFKLAVSKLEQLVDATLSANNLTDQDLDWLVPHQANIRIIQATAKKLNLDMERVILTVNEHGNTSAASIPLALDHGVKNGKISKGQLLLFESFGAGLTWGSALARF